MNPKEIFALCAKWKTAPENPKAGGMGSLSEPKKKKDVKKLGAKK